MFFNFRGRFNLCRGILRVISFTVCTHECRGKFSFNWKYYEGQKGLLSFTFSPLLLPSWNTPNHIIVKSSGPYNLIALNVAIFFRLVSWKKRGNKDSKSQLVSLMAERLVDDNYQLSQLGGWSAKVWPLTLTSGLPPPVLTHLGLTGPYMVQRWDQVCFLRVGGRSVPIQVGIPPRALWHFRGQSDPS